MKFLATNVKQYWLTSSLNVNKVKNAGLIIKESFIGIEIPDDKPTGEQYTIVSSAIEKLFGENKQAFPIRLLDL